MSEWISVEDRLPKTGRWYLINSKCNSPHQPNVVTMAFFDNDDLASGDTVWLTHNDDYRSDNINSEWDNVTHWMPLPEPPEGE